MRAAIMWVGVALLAAGCANNPHQPKLKEPYAAIRPVAPVDITHVDRVGALDYRLDHKTYSGLNWVGMDIRVTPGSHKIAVEYADPTRYIGADRTLIEVREGLRYYVGVRSDRFYLFPEVVKVEPIKNYWDDR